MRWPTRVSGHWPVRPTVSVCRGRPGESHQPCPHFSPKQAVARPLRRRHRPTAMPVEEFIVTNVQWLLPTWFLRLLVRLYLRYSGGPAMRGGDVVIKQIHVDS